MASKLHNADVKVGQHCWAYLLHELLMVVKINPSTYDTVRSWKGQIPAEDLVLSEIIEKTQRPDPLHS